MQIYSQIKPNLFINGSSIALGVFDGVHLAVESEPRLPQEQIHAHMISELVQDIVREPESLEPPMHVQNRFLRADDLDAVGRV